MFVSMPDGDTDHEHNNYLVLVSDVGFQCGIELANRCFSAVFLEVFCSIVCNGLFVGFGQCTKDLCARFCSERGLQVHTMYASKSCFLIFHAACQLCTHLNQAAQKSPSICHLKL